MRIGCPLQAFCWLPRTLGVHGFAVDLALRPCSLGRFEAALKVGSACKSKCIHQTLDLRKASEAHQLLIPALSGTAGGGG
jgi:hypothetical protein